MHQEQNTRSIRSRDTDSDYSIIIDKGINCHESMRHDVKKQSMTGYHVLFLVFNVGLSKQQTQRAHDSCAAEIIVWQTSGDAENNSGLPLGASCESALVPLHRGDGNHLAARLSV